MICRANSRRSQSGLAGGRARTSAWRPLSSLVARLTLAGVFALAALPKIQNPTEFAVSVAAFRVLPEALVPWTALLLPWLELVIAIGLLTPWLKQASAWLIACLLASFIVLHGTAWARGLDISCGCFGLTESSPAYIWLILRNFGLLAMVWLVLKFPTSSELKRRLTNAKT